MTLNHRHQWIFKTMAGYTLVQTTPQGNEIMTNQIPYIEWAVLGKLAGTRKILE